MEKMYYQAYFDHQAGGGNAISSGISRIYVGSPYQRGHGIGKFLGGLFRKAIPLLARGGKAIGREALRTGLNVLGDVARAVPLKESIHRRVKETGGNLKRKVEEKFDAYMGGDGYKRRTLSPFVLNSLGNVRAAYKVKKKKVCAKKKKIVKKNKASPKKKKKKKKVQQKNKKDIFS